VDWKILVAADYGDPTTRRRLFIQAVKGRKRIVWPQITHFEGAGDNLLGYKPWVPAQDIIDWSIPGTSIFDRKKPLADATIRRIAVGIEKYWKDYAKPFLTVLYGSNDVHSLDRPLPTVTTSGNHHALVEPFLLGQQSCAAARTLNRPVPTIATAGAISLIEPFIITVNHSGSDNRNFSLDKTMPTICAGGNSHGLVDAYDLDIRFRMLKSHELKRAQGFPDDYVITGNTTEQTKQIGNAVPVNTARALTLAAIGA
jgi:DNA (cytosine-5)-methyltransferase 1